MVVLRFADGNIVEIPPELARQSDFLAPYLLLEELVVASEHISAELLTRLLEKHEDMLAMMALPERKRDLLREVEYQLGLPLDITELRELLAVLRLADYLGWESMITYLAAEVRYRFDCAGTTPPVIVAAAQQAVAELGIDLMAVMRRVQLPRLTFGGVELLPEIYIHSADYSWILGGLLCGVARLYHRDNVGKYQVVEKLHLQGNYYRKPGPYLFVGEVLYYFSVLPETETLVVEAVRGEVEPMRFSVEDASEIIWLIAKAPLVNIALKTSTTVRTGRLDVARRTLSSSGWDDTEFYYGHLTAPYRDHIIADRYRSPNLIYLSSPRQHLALKYTLGTLQVHDYFSNQLIAVRCPQLGTWIGRARTKRSRFHWQSGLGRSCLAVTDDSLLWSQGNVVKEFVIPKSDWDLDWEDGRVVHSNPQIKDFIDLKVVPGDGLILSFEAYAGTEWQDERYIVNRRSRGLPWE